MKLFPLNRYTIVRIPKGSRSGVLPLQDSCLFSGCCSMWPLQEDAFLSPMFPEAVAWFKWTFHLFASDFEMFLLYLQEINNKWKKRVRRSKNEGTIVCVELDLWDWRCSWGQRVGTLSCVVGKRTHTHIRSIKCQLHNMEIKGKREFHLADERLAFSLASPSEQLWASKLTKRIPKVSFFDKLIDWHW